MSLLERNPQGPTAWIGDLPVVSRYTAGMAGERFFRAIKDDGKILGSYCENCGTSLAVDPDAGNSSSSAIPKAGHAPSGSGSTDGSYYLGRQREAPPKSPYPIATPKGDGSVVEQRSFTFWLVLTICTLGLAYLVYIYLSLDDLQRHIWFDGHSDQERRSQRTHAGPIAMLSVIFVGLPIYYYTKYSVMDRHLRHEHGQFASKLPSPNIMVGLVVLCFVLSFTGIGLISWAIVLYLDNSWQNVFNAHIASPH